MLCSFSKWGAFIAACVAHTSLSAQLLYVGPADFGGRTGNAIFQVANGAVTQLNTGFVEHNFPGISADNRFITFSSPDGVIPALQVPPSSDIYIFDRATGTTNRVVDHTTDFSNLNSIATQTPVSAELSPNNQFLAYGVSIALRQGLSINGTTRELNIVDPNTGLLLSNPTFGRGPTSDSFQAEFIGISWDPNSANDSFVTVNYVTWASQLGTPIDLPTIVRFSRTPGTNDWTRTAILSTPAYFNNVTPENFIPSGIIQIYPSISPSGTGLAYYSLFFGDVLGGSVGVIADLILANSDGSNPRVLARFNQGFYPAGLTWSPDGTQLITSIAQQVNIGTGFLNSANPATAVTRAVSTADGTITTIQGMPEPAYSPFWSNSTLTALPGSLSGVGVDISTNNGQLRFQATGVDPTRLYFLQSSDTLQPGSFSNPVTFTGAQLLDGINLNPPTAIRYFRLIEQ